MDLDLNGRVAVVTGGSSGIGFAAARLLLAEGARVAICGRDTGRLAAAETTLADGTAEGRLLAFPCDVTNAAAVISFAAAVARWADGRVDLLVNNAGQGRVSTFETTTDADWRAELDLKFFSQIHPIRTFKPLLLEAPSPAIVAVNSLLAYQPEPHMVCTSAARAGVQSLIKSLAQEFAPRIRINSVLLGLIDSGQWRRRFEARPDRSQDRESWLKALAASKGIPLQRLGDPEEPARAILFLGSPAASYITGTSLDVSGGVARHI